jgi:hypothetical protein
MLAKQDTTAPEVPADWLVSYRLEHCAEAGWRDAVLIELSKGEATLELHGIALSEILDGPLELHLVTPLGTPDAVYLRGEIRHATKTSNRRVNVGIQFVDLNTNAAQLLEQSKG